jgi:hypothetical protein
MIYEIIISLLYYLHIIFFAYVIYKYRINLRIPKGFMTIFNAEINFIYIISLFILWYRNGFEIDFYFMLRAFLLYGYVLAIVSVISLLYVIVFSLIYKRTMNDIMLATEDRFVRRKVEIKVAIKYAIINFAIRRYNSFVRAIKFIIVIVAIVYRIIIELINRFFK